MPSLICPKCQEKVDWPAGRTEPMPCPSCAATLQPEPVATSPQAAPTAKSKVDPALSDGMLLRAFASCRYMILLGFLASLSFGLGLRKMEYFPLMMLLTVAIVTAARLHRDG